LSAIGKVTSYARGTCGFHAGQRATVSDLVSTQSEILFHAMALIPAMGQLFEMDHENRFQMNP
jgi:hypothetical protein